MSGAPEKTKSGVAVIGLGYVGCVTAACFAHLGHRVYGVDTDKSKAGQIARGKAPFYEPGLDEILREAVAQGRLQAGTEMGPALEHADAAMICVGTPSAENGDLDTGAIERVLAEIAACVQGRAKPLVVAIRSTAFPGTAEKLGAALLASNPNVAVCSNPEFLREGAAMADFMEPSLLVVGGPREAAQKIADLYGGLPVEPSLVSLRTAEMIKYCCNAFHAVKVAFANEVGALSGELGVPAHEVMETFCKDRRLNISPAYLKPGFAFGGSCLPKDLRALNFRAREHRIALPLLASVLPSNERHLDRAVNLVLSAPYERIGIYGLAFKEQTDDLRESPVVEAIQRWLQAGKQLRIYDPHIRLDLLHGANLRFLMKAIPGIETLLQPDLDALLRWSDGVVLAQKPKAEAAARIVASRKPVMDLVGARLS